MAHKWGAGVWSWSNAAKQMQSSLQTAACCCPQAAIARRWWHDNTTSQMMQCWATMLLASSVLPLFRYNRLMLKAISHRRSNTSCTKNSMGSPLTHKTDSGRVEFLNSLAVYDTGGSEARKKLQFIACQVAYNFEWSLLVCQLHSCQPWKAICARIAAKI